MKARIGLVLLLVMALLGQTSAMALPTPCHDSAGMPAAEMSQPETPSAQSPKMAGSQNSHECCDGQTATHCPTGVCLSAAIPVLPASVTDTGNPVFSSFSTFVVPPTPLSSPFRPPIA